MKTIYLTFALILFLSVSVFSQCYPIQNDIYWRIGSPYNSFRVSDCSPYYNCHGFVISYFEGTCQPLPFSYITPAYECPRNQGGDNSASAYQTGGKYVQVCSETNADIAFYEGSQINGGHSAVKVASNRYISKYGNDGPLVSHNSNESWYHFDDQGINRVTSTTFWAFVGSVQGNTNIVGLQMPTFSVNNKSGVTYSWSIPNGYSNISIYSGANQSSVTLNPIHSGTATLQLDISSSCGSVKTQQITLNIQTNVCLEGTYRISGTSYNLNTTNSVPVGSVEATVSCPNATSITWDKTYGNIPVYANGANISFTMPSGGSLSFLVTAKNGSTTIGTRSITFYNYGSFMLFPNPATSEFNIDLNTDLPFTVLLQSFDGQEKKEIKEYSLGKPIDISGLKPGEYSVSIYHEGKPVSKQRLIIPKK